MKVKRYLFFTIVLAVVAFGSLSNNKVAAYNLEYYDTAYTIEMEDKQIADSNYVMQQLEGFYELDSIPTKFALEMLDFLTYNIPFAANTKARLHDLSIVFAIYAYINAYYYLNESHYLYSASSSLHDTMILGVNNTFILDQNTVYAMDNLYLLLAQERLATAYEQIGDNLMASNYWSLANNTLDAFVQTFYDSGGGHIVESVTVDASGYVTSINNYTTDVVTALFSMAVMKAYDPSKYYNLALNTIENYINNTGFYVPYGIGFIAYPATWKSSTPTDNIVDFYGNMLLASALLQHSTVQKNLNFGKSIWLLSEGDVLINGLISSFKDSTTNLFVSYYNVTADSFSNTIVTFENVLFVTQYVEYLRKLLDEWYVTPAYSIIFELFNNLREDLILAINSVYGGETTSGVKLALDWDLFEYNHLIVGYSIVTAFLKLFPLKFTVFLPTEIVAKEDTYMDIVIEFIDSTGIFGSSNKTTLAYGDLLISSPEGLNISTEESFDIESTRLDGNDIVEPQFKSLNFTADAKGSYSIEAYFTVEGYDIFFSKFIISVIGRIGITTDPSTIQAIEGQDESVSFAIFVHDELGYGVPSASVNVSIEAKEYSYKTDTAGYVYVNYPIESLIGAGGQEFQTLQANWNATVMIYASKKGYLDNTIFKTIKIMRNSLVLTISPSPLSVKEGNDLTVYVSVSPQIQANVYNPKASFYLNGKLQTPKGLPVINLPNTVTLTTSSLKEESELAIYVTADNFRSQWYNLTLTVIPLTTFEKIGAFFSYLASSTWAQVLGSLGVVWVVLWNRIRLLFGLSIRCPYCGEITRAKKPVCKHCGRVIDQQKYKTLRESPHEGQETQSETHVREPKL